MFATKKNATNTKEKIMSNLDIIRAWKDEEYRNSLTKAQRSQLPENPAGAFELSDSQAQTVTGGSRFIQRRFCIGRPTTTTKICDLIRS